jgi:hypothetical protein
MWWATVMIFGRNNTAQYIFQAMQMIRKNWTHYRDLYGIDQSTYRNDFALSIAIGIISGHTGRCTDIPWPMISAMPDTKVIMLDQDSWMFRFNDQHSKPKELMLAGCDFHAMGKYQLETAIEAA